MSDEEIIKWAKEKYPQYLGNIELLRSLYKRQVKGESVAYTRRRYKMRRLNELKIGEKVKLKFIIIEIRRSGVKNKKWFSLVIGDVTGMSSATLFLDKNEKDVEEGKEYISLALKKEDGLLLDNPKEVTNDESAKIDELYDYIYELNGGKLQKDKLMNFAGRRGYTYEDVKEMFGLEEDGDMVVG